MRNLISIYRVSFSWRFRKGIDIMNYANYYSWCGIFIQIKRFIIWDIRLSQYWIWRKIRELQGETY